MGPKVHPRPTISARRNESASSLRPRRYRLGPAIPDLPRGASGAPAHPLPCDESEQRTTIPNRKSARPVGTHGNTTPTRLRNLRRCAHAHLLHALTSLDARQRRVHDGAPPAASQHQARPSARSLADNRQDTVDFPDNYRRIPRDQGPPRPLFTELAGHGAGHRPGPCHHSPPHKPRIDTAHAGADRGSDLSSRTDPVCPRPLNFPHGADGRALGRAKAYLSPASS
jgi:hypothetical protein